ncbi:MAG: ferritin family protein [Phycisphaerae bacterium]|jgi:rubrerythrin
MKKMESVNDILDFAIEQEIASQIFYYRLAADSAIPEMRQVFEGFTKEEKGHQARLESMKAKDSLKGAINPADIQSLGLSDYLVDAEPTPDMEYKDALILAMKKEKAAYRLYTDLAELSDSTDIKDIFLFLAQEEAKHKLRFEVEYDDTVLHED